MDLRIHKTQRFLRSCAPGGLSSTIIVNYTCSTRELHKRDFFLIAELPEAFLHAPEETRSQTEVSARVRNEPKFVPFFSKMYVAK
jgi:hypothetical protein